MKKLALSTLSLACISVTSPALALFDDPLFGEKKLRGEIGDTGVYVEYDLDQVNYRSGSSNKAYIKPEEYKISVDPLLKYSIGGKVTCDKFRGPGLKGLDHFDYSAGVDCQWKSRPGSNAEIVAFKLTPANGNQVQPKYYRGRNGIKNLKGVIYDADLDGNELQSFTVTLPMDMYDYRNGNSHKAFILPTNRKVNLGDFSSSFGSLRNFKCNFNGRNIRVNADHDTVGLYGTKKVDCTYELDRNGKDPHYLGTVTFN
ncbi:hypothetical protein BIZ37_16335 [Photobacterium sp. BZF1]|uniref:hypothetical protein n=1 Tax=Photobacterium sp. BZF1 TaxID=1904457 RepID=UPI001653D40B|nr:hypothetical protein [Photobacterium sp. BZF1]MBC7004132.1 hypothetical protein [Photobacterium sp. BZF1]